MARILLALTSTEKLGTTGRRTGFYAPEAARPFGVFTAAGHGVDFVSVRGGQPPVDGVKPDDTVVAKFLLAEEFRLSNTPVPAELSATDYAAIFYVGGHGTIWDFPDDEPLARLALGIYENGGVLAAVCHGPAGLVNLRVGDGSYLVAGKRLTSFTDEEEAVVGLLEEVPFALESTLRERGAEFIKAANFTPNAVIDGRLVTGQNPASATATAELVVQALRGGPAGGTR